MTRSLWKGPYYPLPSGIFKKRNCVIIPSCVGHTYFVHNGRKNVRVTVSSTMIGHKFGEFALTRKFPKHKTKQLKKNRKK